MVGVNFVAIVKKEEAKRKRLEKWLMIVPIIGVVILLILAVMMVMVRMVKERQVRYLEKEMGNYKSKIEKMAKVEAQEYFYYLQVSSILSLVESRQKLVTVIDKGLGLVKGNKENWRVVRVSTEKGDEMDGVYKMKNLVEMLKWEKSLRENKEVAEFEEGGVSESGRDPKGFYQFLLKLGWKKR